MKPEAASASRFFAVAVLLALLLGGAARFHAIDQAALTHWDEGPYVGFPLGVAPYQRGEPLAIYSPPLYPLLNQAALSLLGADPRVGVGVAALLGLACVLLAGLLARRLFGAAAGAVAALIVALDPLHVTYSRMALTETTFTAAFLCALLLFQRAFESKRILPWVLAGGASGLTLAAKYHGFLPLVAAALVAVLEPIALRPRNAAERAPFLRLRLPQLVAAGLAFLPFLALVLWFIHAQMGLDVFAATRREWVHGFHAWTAAALLRCLWDSVMRFGTPALLVLAPIGALLAWRQDRRAALLVLAPLLLLLLVLVPYQCYTRLIVPASVLLAPLAALASARIAAWLAPARSRALALLLVALALATGAPALTEALCFRSRAYPDMARQLAARLAAEPGPVVVVAQQALFPYLDARTAASCWSIREREALRLLDNGTFRYILTDRPLRSHASVAPRLETLPGPLVEVLCIPNPLRAPILYDRLGPDGFGRAHGERLPAALEDETTLRLLELRPR